MAKFCRECGKELEENSKFCKNCGTKIEEEKTKEANASNENTNESAASNAGTNVTYNQTYVTKKSNGMAIAGFVISLVSLLCCGYSSWLGLIFSIIGLVNANKNEGEGKGLAIAGIVISSILLILIVLLTIFGVMASVTDDVSSNLNLPTY